VRGGGRSEPVLFSSHALPRSSRSQRLCRSIVTASAAAAKIPVVQLIKNWYIVLIKMKKNLTPYFLPIHGKNHPATD
jgi:hypothetical protein